MRAKPPRFSARHQGNSATYFARKMAGRGIGRVSTQSRFCASRSRPKPSVAKLTVHIGKRNVVNSEKTTALENTKNPLASWTAAWEAAKAIWWIDASEEPQGREPARARLSRCWA